jgi:putative salt-induced outer membrane protein YdiY
MLLSMVVLLLQATTAAPAPTSAPNPWSGEGGASYVATGGNTASTMLGGTLAAAYKGANWRAGMSGELLRTRTDGVVTAKRGSAAAQMEHGLISRMSITARLSYYTDPFADRRALNMAEVGLQYRPIDTERKSFSVLTAIARTNEIPVSTSGRSYTASRTAVAASWKIRGSVNMGENADTLYDFGLSANWKIRNDASLAVDLNRFLALKFSHQYFYAHRPPVGKKSGDTTLLVSLVVHQPNAKE